MTISNWAFAAQRRWGAAWIVTPDGLLAPEEARVVASRSGGSSERRVRVPGSISTLAKDVRGAYRSARSWRKVPDLPIDQAGVPFVWQHHDLFQKAGVSLAKRLERPLVLFVDAMQVWEARAWGVRRRGWGSLLERIGEVPQLRRADAIACVTEEVADVVISKGIPRDRVLVTPCTADGDLFHPAVSGESVRQRYGLDESFVVGWVGSFRGFHAVDLIVEAFALARREIPSARLVLVGDGQERSSIEALARNRGLEDVVFTGSLPFEEIPAAVAAFDVAIMSSRPGDSFHYSPLKLKEYLAAGKAIVAPIVGEMARTLREGIDSVTYRPGDLQGLAAAIVELSRDADLRERLGRGARARFNAEPDADEQLARVIQVLHRAGHAVP